jgi:hypothetical protein
MSSPDLASSQHEQSGSTGAIPGAGSVAACREKLSVCGTFELRAEVRISSSFTLGPLMTELIALIGLNHFGASWQRPVGFVFIEADSIQKNSVLEERIGENITFQVLIGSEVVHGSLAPASAVPGSPSGNGTVWKGTVKVQQLGTYILAVYRGTRQLPNSPFRWNHLYFPV